MTSYATNGAINLIDELRSDSKIGKDKHFNASKRKLRLHNFVGIPVIVINIFIGTVIVSLLSDTTTTPYLPLVTTSLAFAAAALSAMQTFFNFHKSSEGHCAIGNRYLKTSRNCKMVLRKHLDIPYSPEKIWAVAKTLQKEYLKINVEAEAFPTNNKDLTSAKSKKEVTPFILDSDAQR